MSAILCAMLMTATIEIIVLSIFIYVINKKESLFYILLVTTSINFVTNFILNTFTNFNIIPYYISLIILEPTVVIVEALFYNKVIRSLNIKQSLLISFIANFSSFMSGVILILILIA